MKIVKGNTQLAAQGRELEKAGQLVEAAAAYQQVVDTDPGNKAVVSRLLMIYRRLKEYKKELAVIDAAMGAVAHRDKSIQDKWLSAHPESAKLGKAFLRSLGGQTVTAYGTDPLVAKLEKRRALVAKKIGGKASGKGASTKKPAKKKTAAKQWKPLAAVSPRKPIAAVDQRKPIDAVGPWENKTEERQLAIRERQEAAARKKALAATAKREAAEIAAQKAAEKQAAANPSLFVVSLRYLVSLEKIDAAMARHVAFLNKHFTSGTFLVSGRQVPRTGGIILTRGKDRAAVERIMNQDPFIKGKLASVDIVEFKVSQVSKGLQTWLKSN